MIKLDEVPRVVLHNRIRPLRTGKVWQWIIYADAWPVAIGHTSARQCWFACCAVDDYMNYPT